MNWFYNIKTGAKLGIGFGLCLVLTLALGVLSLNSLSKMNAATERIISDPLDGTAAIGKLTSSANKLRLLQYQYALENTAGIQAGYKSQMLQMNTRIEKGLTDYEATAFDPEDKANTAQLKSDWADYDGDQTAFFAIDPKADQKQYAYLNGADMNKFNTFRSQLETMVDWNSKHGSDLAADAGRLYQSARVTTLVLLVAAIACGIAAALLISRLITRNLSLVSDRLTTMSSVCVTNLEAAMTAAALGDLSAEVKTGTAELNIHTSDEFGKLAATFNTLLGKTKSSIASFEALMAAQRQKVEVAKAIAGGDLTCSVAARSDKDTLALSLAQMVSGLSDLVAHARVASDNIVQASGEVSAGNEDLAQRTEEQASSLEETASSMEEMTSTVKQNADNAKQANALAAQARSVAEKGGDVVGNAVHSMEEINASSRKIVDIVSVIDEIAFQTNLLALNASVEAARVGEQGRGFAVVASEVRSLAGRSASAAKEIKALVQDSAQKVEEGSSLVNESGAQLAEIVQAVKKVADIIAEISAASQEQAIGIEQVNKAIMQMDQITQMNAALVEEASATSQTMSHQAKDLQGVVSQFKLDPSRLVLLQQQSAAKSASRPAALANGTTGRSAAQAPRAARASTKLHLVEKDDDAGFEEF